MHYSIRTLTYGLLNGPIILLQVVGLIVSVVLDFLVSATLYLNDFYADDPVMVFICDGVYYSPTPKAICRNRLLGATASLPISQS